jgi:hypothetical protein
MRHSNVRCWFVLNARCVSVLRERDDAPILPPLRDGGIVRAFATRHLNGSPTVRASSDAGPGERNEWLDFCRGRIS